MKANKKYEVVMLQVCAGPLKASGCKARVSDELTVQVFGALPTRLDAFKDV